ncbi:MAG: YraN family protein [Saprospiraceae bacterium]|nr:YraN family protein [Saprospiraceae bacterium]
MKKSQIGQRGENLATEYVIRKGMKILARNWRSGRQELDIIALDGDQVVFIEVKTRSSQRFGQPIEFITATKQDHMVKAATQWLMTEGWEGEFRFDLIGILSYPDEPAQIQHVRDAFFPFF